MEAVKETERNKIWHNSLGDEDDAETLNTCIAQRKLMIPHSMMKTNCNMTCVVTCVVVTALVT